MAPGSFVIVLVVGIVIAGFGNMLLGKDAVAFGGAAVAAISGGLVGYALATKIGLPWILPVKVGSESAPLFWIVVGSVWGVVMLAMVAGPSARKGSGVR